jgi:FMN phosphatase YigB (HAD superfamily)
MYPGMLELIKLKGLLPDVDWDIVVDSSIEGVRKPQEKIFELSEQRAKVRSEQILFIENTQRHIDAAKQRGWNTFLYDPGSLEKSNKDLEAVVYL